MLRTLRTIKKNRSIRLAALFCTAASFLAAGSILTAANTKQANAATVSGLQTVSMSDLTSGTSNDFSAEIDFEKIPGFVMPGDFFERVKISVYVYANDRITGDELNVCDEEFIAVNETVNVSKGGITMTEVWQNNEDATGFFDCDEFISDTLSALYNDRFVDFTFQISCSVSYNGNVYTDSTGSIVFSRQGMKAYYLPPDPVKTGYLFAGWYLDEGLNTRYTGQPVTSDMTLYAKFTPIVYNITYTLNGGTNHASNPATYTIESAAISLQNPTRNGYSFTSWAGGASIPKGSTGDKSFTANWTAINYTVTYNLNGGTNHAGNPASYTIESAKITLQNPTRPGYTFDGWTEGSAINAGSTGNKTFTAKWKIITYNISYEMSGGTNHADNPATYTVETGSIILKTPTRTGYTFKGWKEGDSVPMGSTGYKTFTAEWEIIMFKVTFKVDGEEYIKLDVPYGTRLVEDKDVQTLMQVLKLSGYTDEEAEAVMTTAVYEDVMLTAEADASKLRAVSFVAWFLKYWWTLLIGLGVIAGVIGYVVIYRKKKRG